MDTKALDTLSRQFQENPASGQNLILYALVKTLSSPNGQYLFLLNKLRDLDESNRTLAYALIELMVAGGNTGDSWDDAVTAMDTALRG